MQCAYLSSVLPKCPNNTPLWEYTYSWLGIPSLWRADLVGATETRHSAVISSEKEIGGVAHKSKEHYSCKTVIEKIVVE